jgi:hypothetical protein
MFVLAEVCYAINATAVSLQAFMLFNTRLLDNANKVTMPPPPFLAVSSLQPQHSRV